MRNNEIREVIFSKYMEPKKLQVNAIKHRSRHKKGSSLEDFYQEVSSKNSLRIEHVYNGKSADEITRIMIDNRRAIEAKKQKRI